MRRATNLLVLGFLLFPATAGQGQLIGQSIFGTKRICVYAGRAAVSGRQRRDEYRAVGLGEPCPRSPPEPETIRQRIPSMATLRTYRIAGSSRVCIYTDHLRDYERSIPVTSYCPLTPHF